MGGDTFASLSILRGTLGHSPNPDVIDAVAGLVETMGQLVVSKLIRGWANGEGEVGGGGFRGVLDGVESLPDYGGEA